MKKHIKIHFFSFYLLTKLWLPDDMKLHGWLVVVVHNILVLDAADLRQPFRCRSQDPALDQGNGVFGFVVQGL